MKRNLWVPALILVVLVAAGALWRLRGSRSAARPAPATGAELGHAHGAGHTPIDEPELREGPPRVIAEDDPAGSLRLEGQVLDDAEHPVAEAVVSLASAPPRQARTAADGTFAFDGLLARPYTLAARAPSGVAGPVTARLTAKSDPVVLRLRPGAQVHIEVVDARQQPVAVATVELRGVSEQSAQTKDGKVTFAPVVPGPYQAVAWADGYARAYLPAMIGAGTTALRIELARGAPVSGKVVDERGAPVAGARVRYDAASDFGPGATGGTGHRDAVTTTADGAFTFASLPAGSFRFLASHPEFATGISSLVALSGESAKTDVEIAMPAGAVVSGKVVDDRGKPVDAARVRIGVAQAGFRFSSPPREAYSNAAGEFTVRGLPRRELSAVALHESGASSTQLVDAQKGEVTGVLLTVDATGTIAGVVVDSSGQPVESAQVSAVPDIFGRRGRGAAG
ncbi:MAG TPA: carboxypeptidase regulatory-like domain-containing protein, partial [Kofleriaceae bacterium]|nr:carboxypeptidase regulatory-like domain-containing protein [Kofleriaceae bacterium]